MTRPLLLVLLVAASGCQTVLRFSRPAPPEGNFGNVRTMSVEVKTAVGRTVENSVVNSLLRGEIGVPIRVDDQMKTQFEQRLTTLGFAVCPTAPCGDGTLTVVLTQSEVGNDMTRYGPEAHSRIACDVTLLANDGTKPYDFNFWDRRTGSIGEGGSLVRTSVNNIGARFEATLRPGRQNAELPLEDGGELDVGVNLLLSSQWRGAIDFFTRLTQQQPDHDGAWYDLGVAWEVEGDWSQALAAYEQAAARNRKRNYLDAVETARRMAPAAPVAPQTPQPMPTPVQPIPLN
ncbi:MAG: hypothetical protein QM817_40200 [Archangium sp.]